MWHSLSLSLFLSVWQEVAKRTTTYNTAVQEQEEEDDDDDAVEDTEEDFFHQQVRLPAAHTFQYHFEKTLGCLTLSQKKRSTSNLQ